MVTAVKSKRKPVNIIQPKIKIDIHELVAFCPRCKNLQTLWFIGGRMVQTRKFAQRGEKIYHDCGSENPCRLYRFS